MISGANQADVALLVVDATRGEFETGFEQGGQTREHALLVRSLGVSQLCVVVNKLDTVGWSKDRFDEICGKLRSFLKQVCIICRFKILFYNIYFFRLALRTPTSTISHAQG